MEEIIKITTQVLFAVVSIFFVTYSVVAIYSLNAYGRTKTFTSAVSIVYSAVVAGLLTWGFAIIIGL